MPKGTLAHLLVEKGTYDDGDYVFDGEDDRAVWVSGSEKKL